MGHRYHRSHRSPRYGTQSIDNLLHNILDFSELLEDVGWRLTLSCGDAVRGCWKFAFDLARAVEDFACWEGRPTCKTCRVPRELLQGKYWNGSANRIGGGVEGMRWRRWRFGIPIISVSYQMNLLFLLLNLAELAVWLMYVAISVYTWDEPAVITFCSNQPPKKEKKRRRSPYRSSF